ncbi:MAG: hypothetical protein JO228_13065 [Xanthobacteraceae bacterium]|nr:hypothetical protein [Xanthobacteraceae bacterium]
MRLGAVFARPVALACVLAAFASSQHAGAAPRAAELGPPAPLAEPSGGYVGRIKVSPAHGPVGTPVAVSGDGFAPGQEFDLVWGTVTGRWKVSTAEYFGREYTPAAYRIATVKSDAAGRIAATFTAPDDFGFQHDVLLQQGARLLTKDAFSIDMTVKLLADNVPVGTPIPVEVQGIGWRELEGSWVMLYDNRFTGWMSTVTTGGTARFTIPAAGQPGRHVIEVVHSDFTFPYRNMQQSPAPDRPQFKVGFNIVEGPPVLPAAPPQQRQGEVRRLPPPGELVASPAFAGVGQPVVVEGLGFAPGKAVALNWTTVTGNRIGGGQVSSIQSRMTTGSGDRPAAGGWEERSRVVAEATADATGRVAFRFETPDDLGGSHGLWADTGTGERRTGTLWIAPTALPLDVARGPVETTFKIHLKGVGWSETANIYTVVYDNGHSGYACGFNSQGDVEIFMQATGEPGWHFIDLYPAIYKGKETRPVNYRLPQLTAEQDHPGEDLPIFHFAFEVTPSGIRASRAD